MNNYGGGEVNIIGQLPVSLKLRGQRILCYYSSLKGSHCGLIIRDRPADPAWFLCT